MAKTLTTTSRRKPNTALFMIYVSWNIIRYIIIAILIHLAITRELNDIHEYEPFCCDCYYVALDPLEYDIPDNVRFDLSYCIPSCCDCDYCNTNFNDNAQNAFDYNGTVCPTMTGYQGSDGSRFSWDWDAKTKCASQISYTSMFFFVKSYTAYGVWSIIVAVSYGLCLIGSMYYLRVNANVDLMYILLRWILIYNILVSEVFLYLIFKPFQYHNKDLMVGKNKKKIMCQVSSIRDVTSSVISVTIYLSIGLVLFHVIYIAYKVCLFCSHCIESYKRENRMKQVSVSISEMDHQINYGSVDPNMFALCMIKYQQFRRNICGIVVAVLMAFFLTVSIYATYRMIHVGHEEYDESKVTVISLVMSLIFLSLIDSPWICSKIHIFHCCKLEKESGTKDMHHSQSEFTHTLLRNN
eukprot:88308_1